MSIARIATVRLPGLLEEMLAEGGTSVKDFLGHECHVASDRLPKAVGSAGIAVAQAGPPCCWLAP